MALEEAFLADQGFMEKLMHDIHTAAGNSSFDDSFHRWSQDLNNNAPSEASVSLSLSLSYIGSFSSITLATHSLIGFVLVIKRKQC